MPATLFESKSVGELVSERIGRASLFEKLGIDFCCNGNQLLPQACQQAGVELAEVCSLIQQDDLSAQKSDDIDWTTASPSDLIDHIVNVHHSYLREAFPQIERLLEKIVEVHGLHHPELQSMRELFSELKQELEVHMMKEEQVLFPIIKTLEQSIASQTIPEPFHCGSVNNPIRMMEHEHDNAGEILRRLRQLSNQYQLPEDACTTYQLTFNQLSELETDLHLHIHKENNILFPAGTKMEQQLEQR